MRKKVTGGITKVIFEGQPMQATLLIWAPEPAPPDIAVRSAINPKLRAIARNSAVSARPWWTFACARMAWCTAMLAVRPAAIRLRRIKSGADSVGTPEWNLPNRFL